MKTYYFVENDYFNGSYDYNSLRKRNPGKKILAEVENGLVEEVASDIIKNNIDYKTIRKAFK